MCSSISSQPYHRSHGCEKVCSFCFVMFFSTLGALSDESVPKLPYYPGDREENSDFQSAPGSRGESTSAGYWEHVTFLPRDEIQEGQSPFD